MRNPFSFAIVAAVMILTVLAPAFCQGATLGIKFAMKGTATVHNSLTLVEEFTAFADTVRALDSLDAWCDNGLDRCAERTALKAYAKRCVVWWWAAVQLPDTTLDADRYNRVRILASIGEVRAEKWSGWLDSGPNYLEFSPVFTRELRALFVEYARDEFRTPGEVYPPDIYQANMWGSLYGSKVEVGNVLYMYEIHLSGIHLPGDPFD